MDATQQPASVPPVDHKLEGMECQEEEQLKFSQESSEGASDENTDSQGAGAAWDVHLRDPVLVSIQKLFEDISRSATEGANNIERRGHNRHNMDLLRSLLNRCSKLSQDIERLYKDIKEVIKEEEGTDTGSAQGNYNLPEPVSCQKFGPVTILLLQKLLPAARSVGIIFVEVQSGGRLSIFACGTCFRVGTKYVMTCKHVLDEIANKGPPENAFVEFNFLKDFKTFKPIRFQFIKQVALSNIDDLDYCVLEFSIPADLTETVKTHLPALGTLVCDVEHSGTITLVGHPGGDPKVMDPNCPYPHPYVGVYRKLNPQPSQLNDPRRVTYCSLMGLGSSGSPGFNEDGDLVVMHACRYRPHDQNIEQGVKMTAIRDDLRQRNPDLCEELFPTSRGLSTTETTS
ncbi:protein FAM111A-like [Branchiostoma floridae]|uniref:Protein FAM111A-like n=1 Tax=Branchiostoma floridae TaxID=7739 RepID=A0A9J7N1G4_BRAFL|nr:protein FAM111A-like [Branchiostoma floridae]XP_035687906.1 protein FAM111A-like [Branchiostoma floridae]XP_035687907.1 protein FAM111A-like [Branchiostoma floridae]XP_035687908.1 protein FAM111A-like [Branchiostoma floridae]